MPLIKVLNSLSPKSLIVGIFLLNLAAQTSVAGSQKIFLLTALSFDNRIDVAHLEQLFKRSFDSDLYEFVIIHGASQYDLWRALHAPQAVALIWLSHAGCTESLVPNFARQVIMPDANKRDALPVLKEIHPNLRFLGIVACNSAAVIKKARFEQNLNPQLVVKSFEQKITAEFGLLEALEEAKLVVRNENVQRGYPVSLCPKKVGYPLTLRRKSSEDKTNLPPIPLRIETNRKEILGMFQGQADQQVLEEVKVFFPITLEEKRPLNLDLFFEEGRALSSLSPQNCADIKVSSSWDGATWSIIPELQGITTCILSYQGPRELKHLMNGVVSFEPFDCSPMPPLKFRNIKDD